jgi:TolB protein
MLPAFNAALIVAVAALRNPPTKRYRAIATARQFTHVTNVQRRPTNDEPYPSSVSPEFVIESNRSGKQQIYVVSLQGMLKRRVTVNAGDDDSPAWSHDGKSFTYVSTRAGVTSVYSVDSDGRNERRLASGLNYFHPMWSPDDERIMYNAQLAWNDSTFDLWTMRRDGSDKRRLTNYNQSETTYGSWSPDGQRIVFRRKFPPFRSQIFVANADATGAHNVSSDPYYDGWPSWSPDGSLLVFASNRLESDRASLHEEIFIMKPDGTGVRLVSRVGGRNVEPRFSRDGRSIYFSHCVPRECQAYVAPVPSGGWE